MWIMDLGEGWGRVERKWEMASSGEGLGLVVRLLREMVDDAVGLNIGLRD